MTQLLFWSTLILLVSKILNFFTYSWYWIFVPLGIYSMAIIILASIPFIMMFITKDYTTKDVIKKK